MFLSSTHVTVFAMAWPPAHYNASLFLTSIVAMYLLQRCCTFRTVKRFVIVGLILVGLIILHDIWFLIEYPNRLPELIDVAILIVPAGLIGTVLGLLLGTLRLCRIRNNEKENEA